MDLIDYKDLMHQSYSATDCWEWFKAPSECWYDYI